MMEINFHNLSGGEKRCALKKMWVNLSLQAFFYPCASPEMLEILPLRLSREVFPLRIFAACHKPREKHQKIFAFE